MTTPKLYIDFHYPVALVDQVAALSQGGLKNPGVLPPIGSEKTRYWLSQARRMDDPTTEIIIITFKQPSSVSKISFDLLQVSQKWSVFYYNRAGARIPVRDQSYGEINGQLSSGSVKSWYNVSKSIYPIVATKLEILLKRVPDFTLPANQVVPLGMRNLLIKREVYTRDAATLPLEPSTDPMGNLVVKTVKDWDAAKAVDSSVANPYTFWKSAPQPSPHAVVCFYMDVRDSNKDPQRVDRVFLDPVYSGQFVNLYYSNDDTIRTRRLGTTQLTPTVQTNTSIVAGRGLDSEQSDSIYTLNSTQVGLKRTKSFWMGIGWSPNFPSNSPPPLNLTLFTAGIANYFTIVYNVMTQTFTVTLGTKSVTTSSVQFGVNVGVEVVVGVTRSSDNPYHLPIGITVYIASTSGQVIASAILPCEPPDTDFLPSMSFKNVEGYINSVLLKQESLDIGTLTTYLHDKGLYLVPDPVQPDRQGLLPSTSLDNAILCADFTLQALAFGGVDSSYFEDKKWTPIFRDFTVQRGFLYFPQPVIISYLKLEFTNLTEQSYPIWEDGIQVKYQSYPISVLKTTKDTKTTYSGTKITNGKRSSISPIAVNKAYRNSEVLDQDVSIKVGDASLGDVPHLLTASPSTTVGKETSSSVVYKRTNLSTKIIAKNQTYTVVSGDWLIKIAARYNLDWHVIYNANKNLVDSEPRVSLLPSRSPGWWIFPGQQLRIPSQVMESITSTTTTVTRKKTTETTRARFSITQVHRYDIITVTRDAALAYFAGLKNVQAYRISYIAAEDTDTYTVLQYDTTDFILSNTVLQPNGTLKNASPTTGTGRTNLFLNPGFEEDLYGWYTSTIPSPVIPSLVSPSLTRTSPGYLSGFGLTVDFIDLSVARVVASDISTVNATQYIASLYVKCLDPLQQVQLVALRGDGSTVIGTLSTTNPGYQRISVIFTANSTTTTICLQPIHALQGLVVSVDGALCETGNTLAPYFDGTTSFCFWTSPTRPNRSTSVEYLDVTRNFVSNPCFEYGLVGWVPYRGTPVLNQANFTSFTGTNSMRVGWETTTAEQTAVSHTAVGLRIGEQYTLSAYVYVPTGSSEVKMSLSGGTSTVTPGVANSYRRLTITFTATSYIQTFYFTNVSATTSAMFAFIDSVQLVKGVLPLTYFDGDQPGYTWIGEAGNSQSVALVAAVTRGTVTSNTWPSTSVYRRVHMDVFDSGLRMPCTGIIGVTPVGITPGTPVALWSDSVVKWADSVAPWGALLPLVTATFDASRQFQGKSAALFYRAGNQGAAVGGISSRYFSAFTGSKIRYGVTLYLNAQTTNMYQIQLYDNIANAILFSENISPRPGNWFTYTSHFQTLGADYTALSVRVLVSGNDLETMYVGELKVDLATILYELSNNGGANFYDGTEAIYTPNAYFVFPVVGNAFKVRATLNAPDDYVLGFEATPLYLN